MSVFVNVGKPGKQDGGTGRKGDGVKKPRNFSLRKAPFDALHLLKAGEIHEQEEGLGVVLIVCCE